MQTALLALRGEIDAAQSRGEISANQELMANLLLSLLQFTLEEERLSI